MCATLLQMHREWRKHRQLALALSVKQMSAVGRGPAMHKMEFHSPTARVILASLDPSAILILPLLRRSLL
jgi:hypothetical protein